MRGGSFVTTITTPYFIQNKKALHSAMPLLSIDDSGYGVIGRNGPFAYGNS